MFEAPRVPFPIPDLLTQKLLFLKLLFWNCFSFLCIFLYFYHIHSCSQTIYILECIVKLYINSVIQASVTYFFPLKVMFLRGIQVDMCSHGSFIHFLLPNSIPLYEYTTVYLFSHWWTFRLFPVFCYYKSFCNEHFGSCLPVHMCEFL